MPVTATRFLRRMRGGAQAQLLAADDGHYYVTKYVENPQHRRVLINEWIAAALLDHLRIPTPPLRMVNVPAELIAQHPNDMSISLGTRRVPVQPGWQLGSRYPGDPEKLAVYDYLPDVLLAQVVNAGDLVRVLAFDKWLCNSDARQAVFFRAAIKPWAPELALSPQQKGFVVLMIDHGYVFDGPHWEYPDSALQGLYHRKLIYEKIRGIDDFAGVLDQIEACPFSVVEEAAQAMPPEWVADDYDALARLLDQLWRRRGRVAELLEATARSQGAPFRNWTAR